MASDNIFATDVGVGGDNNNNQDNDGGGGLQDLWDEGSSAAEQVFTSNPNQWSEKQTIGVAIGVAVGVVLILLILRYFCMVRSFCKRKLDRTGAVNPRHTLSKPYVLRRPARSAKHVVNSTDKLPPGCILHGAEKLQAAGLDGRGVRVAIIDTGVDKQHPGLEGRVVRQEWYRLGTPLSIDDHGTHVAGTIHFMAPKANLYDFRVIGKEGDLTSDQAIAEAIRDAVAEGCHVINLSIRISFPVLKDIKKAIKHAHRKGVVIVSATGNFPGDDDPTINLRSTYPSKWKQCLSVAAVRKTYGNPVASFSDIVIGSGSIGLNVVDFVAVGQDVLSLKPGGGFQIMSGTSVASAHVTGMLAAMMTGGGDVKKRAKKLVSELRTTYTQDVTAKGSDNNSTQIGFPTFLTKWEFNKFWRRHSIGMSNINESSSILDGLKRTKSERPPPPSTMQPASSTRNHPLHNSWSGGFEFGSDHSSTRAPKRESSTRNIRVPKTGRNLSPKRESSTRNLRVSKNGQTLSPKGNPSNTPLYKFPRRHSMDDDRRPDWKRSNSDPMGRNSTSSHKKASGQKAEPPMYRFPRRNSGKVSPVRVDNNAEASMYRFPRRSLNERPSSDPSLMSSRRPLEKGRKRTRSRNGRISARQRP